MPLQCPWFIDHEQKLWMLKKLKSLQGLANGLANVSSILPQLWLLMIRNDILSYSEIMFIWAALGTVSYDLHVWHNLCDITSGIGYMSHIIWSIWVCFLEVPRDWETVKAFISLLLGIFVYSWHNLPNTYEKNRSCWNQFNGQLA